MTDTDPQFTADEYRTLARAVTHLRYDTLSGQERERLRALETRLLKLARALGTPDQHEGNQQPPTNGKDVTI